MQYEHNAKNSYIEARPQIPNEMDQSYYDMLYQQEYYNPSPYTLPSTQFQQCYPTRNQYIHQYGSNIGHPSNYIPPYSRMTPILVEQPNMSKLVSKITYLCCLKSPYNFL